MTGHPTRSAAQSASSTIDHDGQARCAVDAALRSRFQSDVIPLLESLHQRAMRMTRNHADAEDLLQETMVKAYAGYRTFRPGSNFNAWLHRILINTYITCYHEQQRRPVECPIDDIAGAQLANALHMASGWRSVEEEALNALPDRDIRAAMHALPEHFRSAVYYADVEGLRYKEIADLMHTSIGTVMSRLHRGRRLLRGLLAEAAQQRGYIAVAQPA